MNDIENLIEYVKDHSNNFLGSKTTLKEKETFEHMYDLLIETLEKQLTNGWIPCVERLPNIGETVLLTVAVNRGISHEYGSVDIAWICDKENKCFYGTDGKYSHDEVTAWQPLPEPYTE